MQESENGTEINRSPWNDAEKMALNKHQMDKTKHPYTCECGSSLVASHSGWECFNHSTLPKVVQTWAHKKDIDDYIENDDIITSKL